MSNGVQWPEGFFIAERSNIPSAEWIERYKNIPTSWVSDCLGRCSGTIGLRTYHNDYRVMGCGPALTVRVRPGDNLMLHKALQLAQKGDMLVVDGGSDVSQAVIGGNMRLTAMFRGIAGIIVDGAIRDLSDWADGRMPIWAKGHTHRGPTREGPGEINVSIACAGMVVNPGDLVIGDEDGIVAVCPTRLASLWPLIEEKKKSEDRQKKENLYQEANPEKINSILRAKGCPI